MLIRSGVTTRAESLEGVTESAQWDPASVSEGADHVCEALAHLCCPCRLVRYLPGTRHLLAPDGPGGSKLLHQRRLPTGTLSDYPFRCGDADCRQVDRDPARQAAISHPGW